ncbi:pseudouridine-5'-phosphate glycosidase [Peptoniphilus asaccharolyticus DSM 20463]|uniref:Pseudouridine-5'-phosphate glycosidase n=2 Tax=Peptoniphilus asaccharolyticus TaxID=1258 RepID=A0A1W1ULM2_PEPAS|nr:pseudouridine-5'-phosphate glycosidase [Peptoniphilus asaccharolyticus]MBL7574877.1 pseudouridine-5'-phosphate glycosidase [Peptoniphilus asaccharolyticus]SMB82006.1 pseudouridine-5'-phosphate glycosidase [Peptoniphilus asaccharolyticus DSM 20463]
MLNKELMKKYMVISEEVQEAMDSGKPIVALESTIISHGMPYPKNLETAKACEEIVRENGCVPATTAIINGKIRVGLTEEELEFMATSKDIIKCSRRDYAYVVSNGLNGATTVATSIITAALAGIKLLVTGGIGGVHRGAEETFDISRDLQEIATNNVAVVCAGAKSILDIGLTLEYLETFGVPVFGYQTKEMPAFYTRHSGFNLDYRMDETSQIANAINTKWDLGLNGGVVVANPIPEEDAMKADVINKAIELALIDAKKEGIHGKETTPFLLDRVLTATGGNSLESNIALVKNNAKIGAQIARELYNN